MELRHYQKTAINMLRQSIATGHRAPILQASTGSGKTVIAGEIIRMAREKGKKVAFIVDRLALVDQASAHLDAVGIDHGIIQGNNIRTDYAKPVQVVSAQTMAKRRPWEFDLGIIDECHCVRKSTIDLMRSWDKIPFIGLSATPWTKGLGKHYDDLLIPITIHQLISEGFLVDADAYGPSKPDMAGVKITAGDYNQKQAGEKANTPKLVADIIETWRKLACGRQTLVFATNVAHSQHIEREFRAAGIIATHIDAYTDTEMRREAIERFKAGEIQVLTSVGVLTTGFDAPNAEAVVLARPTKSLMLHIQMIGRVLRPYEGKKRALILDHAGNIERLGFHTDEMPTELDDGTRSESNSKKRERKEPLPRPCPQCHKLITTLKCPACGYEAKRRNKVEAEAGNLEKIKRKANKNTTKIEKSRFYRELLWYAREHGYRDGWASYKYRERFGVWPRGVSGAPKPPSDKTMAYITHLNIKRAKGRAHV